MVPVQERQEAGLAVLLRGCVPSYRKKQGNNDYKQTVASLPRTGVNAQTVLPSAPRSAVTRGERQVCPCRWDEVEDEVEVGAIDAAVVSWLSIKLQHHMDLSDRLG